MSDLKVLLPRPCGEPWEGMSPKGCNRHCASCDTVIHDLAKLTLAEAEELLDSKEEVCVRAIVCTNGTVTLSPSGSGMQRRMIAAVGASLTLAACQTVPAPDQDNRFEIRGTLPFHQTPIIRSSDGRTWKVDVKWRSTSFRAPDLYPGIYSISYRDACDSRVVENIVIRDSSIDLGLLYDEDNRCIIVGVMSRSKQTERM